MSKRRGPSTEQRLLALVIQQAMFPQQSWDTCRPEHKDALLRAAQVILLLGYSPQVPKAPDGKG